MADDTAVQPDPNAEVQELGQWIVDNHDSAQGTPEYVQKADRYRQLRASQQQQAPQPTGFIASLPGRFKAAMQFGSDAQPGENEALNQAIADKRSGDSPYSVGNRTDRVVTNLISALPDTGIGVYNAAARLTGHPDAQSGYIGPWMRANAGAQELPADAPWYDRYGEAMATGVAGGGRNLLRSVLPAARGIAGGEVGGEIGEALGDRDLGSLIFGGVAGAGPRVVGNTVRAMIASPPGHFNSISSAGIPNPLGYGGTGRPDAARIAQQSERVGIPVSPHMIGDADVQQIVASLQRRTGSSGPINRQLQGTRDAMTEAVNRVADAQGATMESPPVIGGRARQVATTALNNLEQRSSTGQERMQQDIGDRTPVDIAPALAARARIENTRSGLTSDPITQRLDVLQREFPRDPITGNVTSTNVPYEIAKDFRSKWRMRTEGQQPLDAYHADQVERAMTDSMRQSAQGAGVPPRRWSNVQGRTSELSREGGHRDVLNETINRDPGSAYDTMLPGGEQAPQQLQDFRRSVVAGSGPQGDAAVNNIYGSHLRSVLNDTLLARGGSATGPINFAERVNAMHPRSLVELSGGLPQAQTMKDVAAAAEAFHRPTSQGGTGRMVVDVSNQAAQKIASGGLGALLAKHLNLPPAVGAAISYLGPAYVDWARQRMLNSPTARAAMLNQPTPYRPWADTQGIRASLAALNATQRY